MTHDKDTPNGSRNPANRLGLDYHDVPSRKLNTRIIDIHTHVYDVPSTPAFIEAATAYGIDTILSMTPLDDLDALRAAYPGRLEFIAIPRWRQMNATDGFRSQWLKDLENFRERGARRMKFWMAPRMRREFGMTLEDPFFRPLIRQGLDLGYEFMIHVADPTCWFEPGGRYADADLYGSKRDQYPQLEFLLDEVAPRSVIAAHMGGSCEEPEFLQDLLDRHTNLYLDSSATKWIVRAVAARPDELREFMIRNQDRVLFGSDLVIGEQYDFVHYASRYWVHQKMWETDYRGESPIADPDADGAPRLAGLDLPEAVLWKLYYENAVRLGHGSSSGPGC